jgi:uncharacterized membrane protein
MTRPAAHAPHRLSLSRANVRLVASIAIGLATTAWLTPTHFAWWIRALAGWDTASFTLSALAWNIIARTNASETKRRAGVDDPGHKMIFVIAVGSSLVSLLAAGVVLRWVKGMPEPDAAIGTAIALAAIALSWILTHTSYALRYAKLYYWEHPDRAPGAGCLAFPGDDPPADIDFAYFAFTIGMCFQTSDVAVESTAMRREVLVHALLAFIYNTAIVALALNLAINLLS